MNETPRPQVRLQRAEAADDWAAAAVVLRQYWLDRHGAVTAPALDPVADLPGPFAPPHGCFILARVDEAVVGCAALRARPDVDPANACELCHLFVSPALRRFGLGRSMVLELIDHARACGYAAMLFDALTDEEAARGLYASLGFEAAEPVDFVSAACGHTLVVDLAHLITQY